MLVENFNEHQIALAYVIEHDFVYGDGFFKLKAYVYLVIKNGSSTYGFLLV